MNNLNTCQVAIPEIRASCMSKASPKRLQLRPWHQACTPEAKDWDAVVRLVEEGERGVIHKDGALQVSTQPGQVLDAGVAGAAHCGGPVQPVLERTVLPLELVSDGTRVVLQARCEHYHLCSSPSPFSVQPRMYALASSIVSFQVLMSRKLTVN